MHELLKWYQLLSNTKSFKWAKFWGLMLGVLLAGLGYFWLNGHGFEALLILGLPIVFAASNGLESLSLAYQYSLFMHHLSANAEEQNEEAAPQTAKEQLALVEVGQEETAMKATLQTGQAATFPLSEEEKLVLCQYYVFLYLLFHLRKVGEETHFRLVGLPAGRYRQWLKGLAAPGVQLVEIRPGKTTLAELELDAVVVRLAQHDKVSVSIWDFPKAVYSDERNWREYQPQLIEITPGRKVRINNRMQRSSGSNNAPLLLPIYPNRLRDLKIEFKL
jgi:hypothetical protein